MESSGTSEAIPNKLTLIDNEDFGLAVMKEANKTTFILSRGLDMSCVPDFERLVVDNLGNVPTAVHQLIMDCKGITFIDSSGFGSLLELEKRSKQYKVSFAIKDPSEHMSRVLEVSGLIDHFDFIYSELDNDI